MREFKITYLLNGKEKCYYITVSSDDVPYRELEDSIIYRLKLENGITSNDDFEIIKIEKSK